MNLLGILASLTGLVAIVSSCGEIGIQRCTNQFFIDISVTREMLDLGLLPAVTRPSLTTTCRSINRYERCVSIYKYLCPGLTKARLQGTEDMYNYICGNGFELHLRHGECLNKPDLESQMKSCNSEIESLQNPTHKDICNATKNTIDCVKDAVDEECGAEAAEHQVQIFKKHLQPIVSLIDCDLGLGGGNSGGGNSGGGNPGGGNSGGGNSGGGNSGGGNSGGGSSGGSNFGGGNSGGGNLGGGNSGGSNAGGGNSGGSNLGGGNSGGGNFGGGNSGGSNTGGGNSDDDDSGGGSFDIHPVTVRIVSGITFSVICLILAFIWMICFRCKKNKRRRDAENRIQEMNVVTQPGAVAPTYPNYMQARLCHPKLQNDVESGEGGGKGWGGGGGVDNPMYPGLPGKE